MTIFVEVERASPFSVSRTATGVPQGHRGHVGRVESRRPTVRSSSSTLRHPLHGPPARTTHPSRSETTTAAATGTRRRGRGPLTSGDSTGVGARRRTGLSTTSPPGSTSARPGGGATSCRGPTRPAGGRRRVWAGRGAARDVDRCFRDDCRSFYFFVSSNPHIRATRASRAEWRAYQNSSLWSSS